MIGPEATILVELPPGDPITIGDVLAHQHPMLVALGRSDADARDFLASEHYFKTWDNAQAVASRPVDRRFEAATDAIVAGDLPTLQRLLAEDPTLARARSAYGHRQTLLQHVSANGIEWARQWQTPSNAVAIAQTLLAAGAEPDAACESYGPTDTAMTLLCSSCHPAEAGVQAALVDALISGGAAVDGPRGDSDPLWTALTWGYNLAVDALVRCRARADNLVLAAATGDVARTQHWLAQPRTDVKMGALPHVIPAATLLEHALIYAASLDRLDVVELLLAHNPDLSVQEPLYQATARGTASHPHAAAGRPHGNPRIIALLSR